MTSDQYRAAKKVIDNKHVPVKFRRDSEKPSVPQGTRGFALIFIDSWKDGVCVEIDDPTSSLHKRNVWVSGNLLEVI